LTGTRVPTNTGPSENLLVAVYYVARHDILIDAMTMPILRPSRFLRPDETSKSVRGTGDRQGRNAYRCVRVRAVGRDLDLRDLEVFADFAGKKLVDLAVARNRTDFPLARLTYTE
jgi:hypothetical protein